MTKLEKAIKALRIYDECMDELSFFVGHMRGRCTQAAHDAVVEACSKAMQAERILRQLERSK